MLTDENNKTNMGKINENTGMAITLIFLLAAYFFKLPYSIPISILSLVVTMSCPKLLSPFAKIWYGFSHYLGIFVSSILLTSCFILIITPIGLLGRLFGKDSLNLKINSEKDSFLIKRDHRFESNDLKNLF
jgi:hypothetical protein